MKLIIDGVPSKPHKVHRRVIDPADCRGCRYAPANAKQACKSCGNWFDGIVIPDWLKKRKK